MDFEELNDMVDDYIGRGASSSNSNMVKAITMSQEAGSITDEQASYLLSMLEELG